MSCTTGASEVEHLSRAASIAGVDGEVALPTSRHLVAEGLRIHLLDWGRPEADPIVLLHGGGLTAHTWDLTCLALSGSHRCIAVDLRGHGDSEWSPAMHYDVEDHLADTWSVITSLGLGRSIVVGHSLGGMVGLALAARHPDAVRGLVLVDVAVDVPSRAVVSIRDFMLSMADAMPFDRFVEAAHGFNPRRSEDMLRHSLKHNLRRTRDGLWTWKYDRRHLDSAEFERLRAQFTQLSTSLEKVECPVLVARGAESEALSASHAARFAARFRSAEWTTVESAGHTVQADNPQRFIRELRSFLARVDKSEPARA